MKTKVPDFLKYCFPVLVKMSRGLEKFGLPLQTQLSIGNSIVKKIYARKPLTLKVKLLKNFKGKELPKYASELASGFDVHAQVEESLYIKPQERVLIPTGLQFEIPSGYELQARPRSGWAIRDGITLLNSPGTIDADYRGEIKIIVINHGQKTVEIEPSSRIAQLVLSPVQRAKIKKVQSLSNTIRGKAGFGSTGKKERKEKTSVKKLNYSP